MADELHIAVYHNLHSGGAKRTLYEAMRRLCRTHKFDLFTLSSADKDFGDVRPFVRRVFNYDFGPGRLFRSPFGRLNQGVRARDVVRLRYVARRIAADIDAGGYDVVLVHPCRITQSPLVLLHLRTPSAYYCHEPLRKLYESPPARPYGRRSVPRRTLDKVDLLDALYRAVLRRADRQSLRAATRVLVNSCFTQENVRRIYGAESHVCSPGVDTDLFRPLGLPRDGTVLSVGAMTPNKGFDLIIEGLGLIPQERRPALRLISNYAETPERAYLERLAAIYGVHLSVQMGVSDGALVEAYNRAAMVVYTPHREPLGLVPLEAMACGTPVLGVREGGVQETVCHEETGLLMERHPQALAEAVETLLDSPELAARYGRRGVQFTRQAWNWDRATDLLEQHLSQTAN